MQESVFGRRFIFVLEEGLRKTLISKFHDHKYVFDVLKRQKKFYVSLATTTIVSD
jgi:hypothetical protein